MKSIIKKDTELFNFFRDYYRFIQEYAIPEENDEFWESLRDESDKLCRKYGNKQYYRDMVLAHQTNLERIVHKNE